MKPYNKHFSRNLNSRIKDPSYKTGLPLVSILIPTYNQDLDLLKECIESCINQTYQNIEIIVSDNHSTNGLSGFLRDNFKGSVRIVAPPKFLDMNTNFAFCADHASGTYLSFLSSDDRLFECAIENLVGALEANDDAVFAFGNIIYAERLPVSRFEKYLIRPDLGKTSSFYNGKAALDFFFPWSMSSTWMAGDLIRADAYSLTGGLTKCDLAINGDVWLTRQLLNHGGFVYINSALALFRARKLTHVEVDPDRRLNEFVDELIMRERENIKSYFFKIRSLFVLLYRIGIDKRSTLKVKRNVGSKMQEIGRSDLYLVTVLAERWPNCSWLIARFLFLIKIIRDVFQILFKRYF